MLNTVEDAAAMVRAVNAPNYGLLYDTFHANIEEKDPVGVIAPNLPYINHVHFSENDRGTPGKGHVPWAATMRALKHGGYDGWCTIEAFGRALPGSGRGDPGLARLFSQPRRGLPLRARFSAQRMGQGLSRASRARERTAVSAIYRAPASEV